MKLRVHRPSRVDDLLEPGTETDTGYNLVTDGGTGDVGDVKEYCDACDDETYHEVSIEIRQESDKLQSREPYRVAECRDCGGTSSQRMNNA